MSENKIESALNIFRDAHIAETAASYRATAATNAEAQARKEVAAALDRLAETLRGELGSFHLSNLLYRFKDHKIFKDRDPYDRSGREEAA